MFEFTKLIGGIAGWLDALGLIMGHSKVIL